MALAVKNPPANAGDTRDEGSFPGLGRSPGEGNGDTPVFLPGKAYGQRSLAGYGPWGHEESETTERLSTHTHTYVYLQNICTHAFIYTYGQRKIACTD